jgi:hypothetical protein
LRKKTFNYRHADSSIFFDDGYNCFSGSDSDEMTWSLTDAAKKDNTNGTTDFDSLMSSSEKPKPAAEKPKPAVAKKKAVIDSSDEEDAVLDGDTDDEDFSLVSRGTEAVVSVMVWRNSRQEKSKIFCLKQCITISAQNNHLFSRKWRILPLRCKAPKLVIITLSQSIK